MPIISEPEQKEQVVIERRGVPRGQPRMVYGKDYGMRDIAQWAKTQPTPEHKLDMRKVGVWARQQKTLEEPRKPHGLRYEGPHPTVTWQTLGYPKYEGRYPVPTVPEGFKIKDVEETDKGLSIVFYEPQTARVEGLSERMLKIETPKFDLKARLHQIFGGKPLDITTKGVRAGVLEFTPEGAREYKAIVKPLALPAGVVASGESFIYSWLSLAGVTTPKIPETFFAGAVSSGIETIATGQLRESRTLTGLREKFSTPEQAASYAFGTMVGDIALSYAIGKALQVGVTQPLAKTKLGQYVGYQFKAHAPKLVLRAVYGKKGAEYIVSERTLAMADSQLGPQYLKDVFAESGKTVTDFPLVKTRGVPTTPMKTTLEKAIKFGKHRGLTTYQAPLQTIQKIVSPTVPTALQFGLLPISPVLPTIAGLSLVLAKPPTSLLAVEQHTFLAPIIKFQPELSPITRVEAPTRFTVDYIPKSISGTHTTVGVHTQTMVKSAEKQISQQASRQMVMHPLLLQQKLKQKKDFDFSKQFKRTESKIIKGYGRYKRQYPVLTAQEMMKLLGGK